jgi:hypothetical protein
MTPSLTAFLDESGNTGANYLDPQQPVHVLAGWLVHEPSLAGFARAVETVREAMGMPELKGGRMLTTTKGRRQMLRLLEEARSFAYPIFSIWEKRFCAALRVVETFLDPMHNPRADWLPAGANLQRNEVADKLLACLPRSYFEKFIAAFRSPTRESLGEIASAFEAALRIAGLEKLAWSFAGCVGEALDEIVAGERSTAEESVRDLGLEPIPRNVSGSLSYPSFAHMIRTVDFLFEKSGRRGIIVHDETSEFARSFAATFVFFKRLGPAHFGTIEDGRTLRGGIGFVDDLVLRSSRDEPLLQAADVLASALKGQGLVALGLMEADKTLDEAGRLVLPGLIQDQVDCPPWSCVASEEFKSRLLRPIILNPRQ